jgi:hypothetical protein
VKYNLRDIINTNTNGYSNGTGINLLDLGGSSNSNNSNNNSNNSSPNRININRSDSVNIKLLGYCLLKLNLQNLKQNINFTGLFRHKTVITSDEDYIVTQFQKAIDLIEKLSLNILNITKNEFNAYMDEYEKRELLKSPTKKSKIII